MHTAAAKGHAAVVELLINNNVSLPEYAKSHPTPLLLAVGNGHLEVVKVFHDHGATFNSIILHHAAAKNQAPVIRFLLQIVGLRDTCIPCKPKQFSKLSLNTTIQDTHTIFCETALHAAVSRGLVEVAKILLSSGTESLECKHHSGKTVLMNAVERNDTDMVDLLLKHGANVSTECGRKIMKDVSTKMCSIYSIHKQDFLYTVYCVTDTCECGNRVIHVSAKYGLWKMAKKITSERIFDMINIFNCDGYNALRIAIANDQTRFVEYINDNFKKEEKRIIEFTVVYLAVKHCSPNVAKLNYLADFKDENLWSLLWESTGWSPCGEINASPCFMAFRDSNLSEEKKRRKGSERRLNVIRILFETHHRETFVSYKKNDGVTLLHHAASHGFDDAVKYLVELGADFLFKDRMAGLTLLMFALDKSPVNDLHPFPSYRCYTTRDGQFRSCHTTCYDETSRYLIQAQRANIAKCDAVSASMLRMVIQKRMPLSLYALLKIGVDISCQGNESLSPLLLHLIKGGHEVSDVLKIFEANVSVKCGLTYRLSELHMLSLGSENVGNFFKPRNKSRSLMQRLIDRHPRGVRILDECYDAEGYLPIHRAAEGGNLAAIKWFKRIGVNTESKTRRGYTALDISVKLLRNKNYPLYYSSLEETLVEIHSRYRDECFEELLQTFFVNVRESSCSNSSLPFKYRILHLACKTGLDVFTHVYKKTFDIISKLKWNKFLFLNEQDENGNTPLHIAAESGRDDVVKYLFGLGVEINVKNKNGNTPLLTALKHVPLFTSYRCYETYDGLFTFCQTTSHDITISHLLWLHKTEISHCDAQSAYLLNQLILKRYPLSLYALLKIGVDINCQGDESLSPILQHIRVGGREVSQVLNILEVDLSVKCLVPFVSSELHLISYASTNGPLGNFFQPYINNKRSVLRRLIDHHRRGVRLLNECYDAEGYLPIHRAAQGGNLAAIRWFKSVGVDTRLKTRSGLTAFDISVLYLGDIKYAELNAPPSIYRFLHGHRVYEQVPLTTSEDRNLVFQELMRTSFITDPEYTSEFSCGSNLEGISPLHIAAVKGITVLKYVHEKVLKMFPGLPINCLNIHRLDPLYLANFYDSIRKELNNEYLGRNFHFYSGNIKDILKEIGPRQSPEDDKENTPKRIQNKINERFHHDSVPAAQNPDRVVEYMMVLNYLYYPSTNGDVKDRLHSDSWNIRFSDCPGYFYDPPKIEGVTLNYDTSECSKIRVRHDYYWSLCIREIEEHHARAHHCWDIERRLRWSSTWRKRSNRRPTPFILERMGLSNDSDDDDIINRFPFYFLHKNLLNKYDVYEYLKILNEALEISDIRFYSPP